MKRGVLSLDITILAVCLLLIGTTFTVAQGPEMPDEISIGNDGYKADAKEPVPFSHKKHAEEYQTACTDCHHAYSEGENVWKQGDPVEKCFKCHNPIKEEAEGTDLKKAFHDNCKGCHKAAVANGKMNAPDKKCAGCHIK
ncbi:MAG: cytochrome c3 family protein [Deltaproteobacteria bacterium]|nr:cytochrome c3 family protein [Deltaproteobacteria bacterium]